MGLIFSNEPYGEGIFNSFYTSVTYSGTVTVVGSVGFTAKWTPGVLGGIMAGKQNVVSRANQYLCQDNERLLRRNPGT